MTARAQNVVRSYFQRVWEHGEVDAVADLLTEDFIDHDAPPGFGTDRGSHRQMASSILARMRAKRHRILAMLSDGDLVAVRHETEWTQDGAFFGIPADGMRLTLKGLDIYRGRDERITESWHCEDIAGVMRQAGASA